MKKYLAAIPAIIGICIVALLMKPVKEKKVYEGLASINKANVYVYHGPFKRSKPSWKLLHKNWPVYILAESNAWVKITDAYKTTGWVEKKHISHPRILALEDVYITNMHGQKVDIILLKNSSVKFITTKNDKCIIEIDEKKYLVDSNKIWYKI